MLFCHQVGMSSDYEIKPFSMLQIPAHHMYHLGEDLQLNGLKCMYFASTAC